MELFQKHVAQKNYMISLLWAVFNPNLQTLTRGKLFNADRITDIVKTEKCD